MSSSLQELLLGHEIACVTILYASRLVHIFKKHVDSLITAIFAFIYHYSSITTTTSFQH
jgi:hypothetical protein